MAEDLFSRSRRRRYFRNPGNRDLEAALRAILAGGQLVLRASLTGIAPGEVALLNVSMPGGLTLSTGVLVLYADDRSFTFMTPQGHMFASWITFSATEIGGRTSAQVQVLLRAGDPLYELALPLGGHRQEDRFWQHTLHKLADCFGIRNAQVCTSVECIDRRRQWSRFGNVWHNAAIRSLLYQLTRPLRRLLS